MSTKTFTTGQASVALGFMVNGAFILKMGLKPASLVKGNPIWDMADWTLLVRSIAEHCNGLIENPPTDRPAAAPKVKVTKPAVTVDDDDEL